MALVGAATLPVVAAEDSKPMAGDLLQGINMFIPEEGDPAYKVKANEEYGTQWYADLAYGYWRNKNAGDTTMHNQANMLLVHAALNQRIIENNVQGGTWLRVEFSGSWGLDSDSAQTSRMFADAFGSTTYPHTDIYGGRDGVIPELSVMHYFNSKRSCIIAGMVNLTNYFDCVGIANDSFSSFVNSGFINSSVLGLTYANLGMVVQTELGSQSYAMLGLSSTTTNYGDNPFKFHGDDGFLLVGEYGRQILDGAATIRINPFYHYIDNMDGTSSNNAGIAASIEYELSDYLTVFSRTGWAARQELGNGFDFTCGAHLMLMPEREDDFLGVAFGVFKPCTPADNKREFVAEAMYSFKTILQFQFI